MSDPSFPPQVRLSHTMTIGDVTDELEIVWDFGSGVPSMENLAGLVGVIREGRLTDRPEVTA